VKWFENQGWTVTWHPLVVLASKPGCPTLGAHRKDLSDAAVLRVLRKHILESFKKGDDRATAN
jgi:hypothetical protein